MCNIFNFVWNQGAHMFFWKEKQIWSIVFFIKQHFYWAFGFKISFYDDNATQLSQLTRDHMWKCDKSKHFSNNGSVKNNF